MFVTLTAIEILGHAGLLAGVVAFGLERLFSHVFPLERADDALRVSGILRVEVLG